MLNMLKKILAWFRSLVIEDDPEMIDDADQKDVPLYLACNGMYMALIENIERQIQQTKIDYALGSIDKETYDQHFLDFQQKVKELSANYARELLLYSV